MNKLETSLHHNSSRNFVLKGFTSILIGIYLMIGAYLGNEILTGFLIDNHPMAFMSPQIIEILIFLITFFVFLFSSLAFLFAGRRKAKKNKYKLWNSETKKLFWKYIFALTFTLLTLYFLTKLGFIETITPVFLVLYSLFILFFRDSKNKNSLLLVLIAMLLGVICFLIPMYWHASLTILGISHITYGVVVKD
jgi:hypothetical protein